MCPFKINVVYFIIFNIIAVIHSLIELPIAEDNNIAATESIIRNTVNNLFLSLRLKDVNREPRLKQFLTIHNFFVSLTLRDHDNLNEIVRLTREQYVNNSSIVTKPLNELLNEDNDDEANDVTVTVLVGSYLNKLKDLKEKSMVNNFTRDTIVNADILKVLKHRNDCNFTNNEIGVDYDNNVLDEFWRDSGRRIYKGTATKPKHFPFMASVQFFGQFQCAGSIIKSDLVITAASCLQLAYNNRFFRENPAFLTVTIGSRFYQGGGENIPILEIYFHPSYNPRNLVNNLAVMRMMRHVNFKRSGKKVKKIDLDRNNAPLSDNTDGITIVGWGARGSSNILNDPWNNRLSFAVLDFYPLRDCRHIYTKEYVTKTNFCAGFLSKGGGACNRDVGGPGVVHGMLTGVVSFGSPVCGAPDAPTVFTKLGYYTDWIEEIMEQDVPENKRRTTPKPERLIPTLHPPQAGPTTYKMAPVSIDNFTPIHADLPNLRMLEESEYFSDFLATMFDSKEIKEYTNLIDGMRQNEEDKITEPSVEKVKKVTRTTEALPLPKQRKPASKQDVYDVSREISIMRHKKYTVLDKNLISSVEKEVDKKLISSVEKEIENEFEQIFDNIEETKLVNKPKVKSPFKNSNLGSPRINNSSAKNIVKLLGNNDLMNVLEPKVRDSKKNTNSGGIKNQDDNVLTLLYLTDNEKNKQDMNYDSGEGLTIPAGSYNDMTFRQNGTDNKLVDVMTKNDLYNLLSEAIDLEMKENQNKDAAAS